MCRAATRKKRRGSPPSLLDTFVLRSATAFTAGVASRAGLRGLAADELVEVALLPASGLALVKQCEAVLVEGFEPIIPADVLQRSRPAESGKVEADHASVAALSGAANAVNFTDGLDGLCTGLSAIAFSTFGVFAYAIGRADWSRYIGLFYLPDSGELTHDALYNALTAFGAARALELQACQPAQTGLAAPCADAELERSLADAIAWFARLYPRDPAPGDLAGR